MLKRKLNEVVGRFNDINSYTAKLLQEQGIPNPDEEVPGEEAAVGADTSGLEGLDDEIPQDPAAEPGAEPTGEELPDDGVTDEIPEPALDDSTEEIDVTDLYNMTKNIKQELENKDGGNDEVMQKMDGVFQMLNDLQGRIGAMDNVISKIDQLGAKVEQMKAPTPQEKLEMRSLDSYPFNEKPNEYFDQKLPEMEKSGKNEYVLTKNDVQNYSKNEIMKTFNPDIKNF